MYSGNSVVVNFLMRFPVLIPVAAAAGLALSLPPAETKTVPAIEVAKAEVLPPIVFDPPAAGPKKVPLQKVEELCPPLKSTKKLTKKQKKALVAAGCKVKG